MLVHTRPTPKKPSRVVVLGAGGFVGRDLTRALGDLGVPTLPVGSRDLDLTDPTSASKLAGWVRPTDSLVMLAALTPDRERGLSALRANLSMGVSVWNALEKSPCSHVIYFSSDAVYPFQQGAVSESSCDAPTDLYGAMHRARELMFQSTVRCPLAILRPTLIYGLGDTHNAYGVMRMLRDASESREITLFGAGEESRDHILIDDVVRLTLEVLTHRSRGILNLVSGESITYRNLAGLLASRFSHPVRVRSTARARPITHRQYDIGVRLRVFPHFSATPLSAGIDVTYRRLESAR